MAVASEKVCTRRSTRGHEPEVVERLRSELNREPADVLERADDELAEIGGGRAHVLVAAGFLDGAKPEQDRRQRLPCLVVQLPCEPASLELLARDDAAKRIPGDPAREIDGDGGAIGELLGESQIGAGETGVGADLVVCDQHPDRPLTCKQRHVEAGRGADPARDVLVHLGILEQRVDSLAAAPLSTRAVFESPLERVTRMQARPRPLRRQLRSAGASPAGSAIATRRAPINSRSRVATRSSNGPSSNSPTSAPPISFSDSSCCDQAVADS